LACSRPSRRRACSTADPRYAFADLENLVRKARIDLQAEVTFLRPRDPATVPKAFGSLNEIASAESQACIALARIDYRHSAAQGWMFIVKPNIRQGLAVDLMNFKADNPLFPQEPTTDQFFSEAQWESYFQLGQALGGELAITVLKNARPFQYLRNAGRGNGFLSLVQSEAGVIGAALRLHVISGGQRPAQLARLRAPEDISTSALRMLDPKGKRSDAREHLIPITAEIKAELAKLAKSGFVMSTDGGKTPMHPTSLSSWASSVAKRAQIEGFQA
jgi:hypothetical protein